MPEAIREHSQLQSSSYSPQNQFLTQDPGGHRRGDSLSVVEEFEPDYGDFTFCSFDEGASPISADVAFHNGQIRPHFDGLSHRPAVKNIFVEKEKIDGLLEEEAVGPYCVWKGKEVEATTAEACKKSNSTGFSRIWRFRDRFNRSISDGKDAYVYLKADSTRSSKREEGSSEKKKKKKKKKKNLNGEGGDKLRKKKAETMSAQEIHYVKNGAMREEGRRRTYLPYRPEVLGFFTSVQGGGLTKNVHPF